MYKFGVVPSAISNLSWAGEAVYKNKKTINIGNNFLMVKVYNIKAFLVMDITQQRWDKNLYYEMVSSEE